MAKFLGMTSLVTAAVGIAIAAIVIAAVTIPILAAVNTVGWSAMNSSIFGYISTFLILGLLVGAISASVYFGGQ